MIRYYSVGEAAQAVAAISVTLPGAAANARCRLAMVMAECDAHGWSDEARVALVRQATAWLALARLLGKPIDLLQRFDPPALLAQLEKLTGAENVESHLIPGALVMPADGRRGLAPTQSLS